jgi:hypothetical protein
MPLRGEGEGGEEGGFNSVDFHDTRYLNFNKICQELENIWAQIRLWHRSI